MKKVAVVTGSSSGIGLLTSVELARRGFQVIATMRDLGRRARLDQAAEVAGVGGAIEVRRLDVTETVALPLIVKDIVRDHGRIDSLINNAGFAVAGFAEDLSLDEVRQQFETNFFGQVAMTRAVLPVMRVQRSGNILMVSSIGGRHATPVISCYCASKFALEGWSEAVRYELRPLGIYLVLIEPGSYATDIWTRNAQIAEAAYTGPNRERGERFAAVVKSIKKPDPAPVARLIARVADHPRPRLRYVVGKDAHLQRWLSALMPQSWYEKLVARAIKFD